MIPEFRYDRIPIATKLYDDGRNITVEGIRARIRKLTNLYDTMLEIQTQHLTYVTLQDGALMTASQSHDMRQLSASLAYILKAICGAQKVVEQIEENRIKNLPSINISEKKIEKILKHVDTLSKVYGENSNRFADKIDEDVEEIRRAVDMDVLEREYEKIYKEKSALLKEKEIELSKREEALNKKSTELDEQKKLTKDDNNLNEDSEGEDQFKKDQDIARGKSYKHKKSSHHYRKNKYAKKKKRACSEEDRAKEAASDNNMGDSNISEDNHCSYSNKTSENQLYEPATPDSHDSNEQYYNDSDVTDHNEQEEEQTYCKPFIIQI